MSHRHHKPIKQELSQPAVSARAFLTGGDSAVVKKKESSHREHKTRRHGHHHHHRRRVSKSGEMNAAHDDHNSTLKVPSLSSLSLSSSSAFSDEQSHELYRPCRIEQIRDAITGAIAELESQTKSLNKVIEHKAAMAIVHMKSGKEFGAVTIMKQVLRTESQRDKLVCAASELSKLQLQVDDHEAAGDDLDEDTFASKIASIVASAAAPSVSLRTNDNISEQAKVRLQAICLVEKGMQITT